MSQENVEVVRRLYEAVERGDSATVFALYHPDVECDASRSPLPRLIGGEGFRGHDGLRRFFRERAEAWENIHDKCEQLIDAGTDVLAVVTVSGRGRTSGIDVETTMTGVWTVRDRQIVRMVWFGSHDEALEAAGLSE